MHRFKIILIILLAPLCSKAQSVDWIVPAGGLKSDKGTKIVVDQDGNIFETGYYNEQGFFGPFDTGFSHPSSKEAYVAKMDPDGNYLWVKNGVNYFDDRGLGLCLDPAGNVYVTGTCWGGLIWGSLNVYNPTSYTDQIFVVKIDTDGNEIWMKNAGIDPGGYPYNDDHGQDIVSDADGNLYVTGFLANNSDGDLPANFDALSVNVAAHDSVAFVARLSNDGDWEWIRTFDGIYESRDNSITVDDENNIYVTGGFVETGNFGTETLTSLGGQDIYVIKYDPDGNFQWVAQAGSERSDRGNDIAYGNDGNLYVAGEFRSVCNWGPDIELDNRGGPGGRDIFVAKISKNGEWKWANKAGSKKGSDKAIGITANSSGNIFVCGQFSSKAKWDDIEIDTDGDSVNVFIAAIDSLGVWRWAMQGGGPIFDKASGIAVGDDCKLYATGFFTNDMTMDGSSASSLLGKDIFTVKMSNVCFTYAPPPPDVEEEITPVGYDGMHLPNAFSPNSDGNNDVLQFYVGDDVASFELMIFDRWGNLVFQSTEDGNYWDGYYKSKLVNSGIYHYTLRVTLNESGTTTSQGNITVMR